MFIGNKPSDYRAPICHYCGKVTDEVAVQNGYALPVCAECDLGNTFSDLYKEEYGVRPRFAVTAQFMRDFVRSH